MVKGIGWGIGKGLESRECARTAAQKALDCLGTTRPALAIALVSQDLDIQQALSGLTGMLGTTPLWGFSTAAPFSSEGEHSHTVLVGLIAGSDLKAQVNFYPEYGRDSKAAGRQLSQNLQAAGEIGGVLFSADGVNGNFLPAASAFTMAGYPVAGCLVSGGYHLEMPRMIAGSQADAGAMAAAILGGAFRLGIGVGHGWKPTGLRFQISRARDVWVQSLNGLAAAEAYSQIFGHSPREWSHPPLSTLVRLYPLGFQASPGSEELVLRSPLHVEVDGSFRMNAPVPEGESASLLAGDPHLCLAEVGKTVQQAVAALGAARPLMALVFVDLAWRMLFAGKGKELISALHTELGDIPMLGCYTVGQIARLHSTMLPQQLNQHLMVVLLGEEYQR